MAEDSHPEVTGNLDQKRRSIVITVAGAGQTATFRTEEPTAAFWSEKPPGPPWGLEAVRKWTRTPPARALFRQLAQLQGKPPEPEDDLTPVDRPPKR
jgi:hypothetical protein